MWRKLRRNLLLMPIDSDQNNFNQIEDNLFVGNIEFAQNHFALKKYNISLVISVYPKGLIGLSLLMTPSKCRFHHIDAKDSPYEDLISHFDICFDMIDEEIVENEGNVLIYCGAGFSRSVTITAAYLMRKHRISSEEAIQRIKAIRPKINPNPGFKEQLQLYEDMNYRLDKTNADYRVFALILLKKDIWSEKYWEDSRVGQLNRQFCEPMGNYLFKVSLNQKTSEDDYRCVECQHILFDEINVLSFVAKSDVNEEMNTCDKLFIEPIKWLTPFLCSYKKGDINCPNCKSLLGGFKWKAFKCECPLHHQLNDSKIIKILKSSVIQSSN